MFIQTEETPNPNALKFLPNMTVMSSGRVVSFRGGDEAARQDARAQSPLAAEILAIPGVVSVMLGGDFVAVTKTPDRSFDDLKSLILLVMMEHIMQGAPFYTPPSLHGPGAAPTDELEAKICALLDARVRPAVAKDGGDIAFSRFEDGVVYVHMQGACAGCPAQILTLKHGVENMLKQYLPEVREVRAEDPWE